MKTETKQVKHTPGPWEYVPDDGTGTLPAVLSPHVNKGGNFYVCQCNVDADGRLISSAPELLSSLIDLVELAEQSMQEANRDGAEYDIKAELSEAKSAISKAEGRI